MLPLYHGTTGGNGQASPPQWYIGRIGHDLSSGYRIGNIMYLGGEVPLSAQPLDPGGSATRPRAQTVFHQRPQHSDRGEVLLHDELPGKTDQETDVRTPRANQAQGYPRNRLREGTAPWSRHVRTTLH